MRISVEVLAIILVLLWRGGNDSVNDGGGGRKEGRKEGRQGGRKDLHPPKKKGWIRKGRGKNGRRWRKRRWRIGGRKERTGCGSLPCCACVLSW